MSQVPFSQRQGFAPEPANGPDEYLPEWVREAVQQEVRSFLEEHSQIGTGTITVDVYPIFKPYIPQVLQRSAPGHPQGGPFAYYIPAVLQACQWWQFYDIVEKLAKLVLFRLGTPELDEMATRINNILAAEGIVWQLQGTTVTRRIVPIVREAVERTHTILNAPKFRGPDEQFSKALGHLNRRPQPDLENCIKDAVGALEAVANIEAHAQGQQLNVLLDREPFRSQLPHTIRQCIDKLYAYRGAAPGVGHGLVGNPMVGFDEALWVLHVAAATIILIANKFH